jgi:hypothetical protein
MGLKLISFKSTLVNKPKFKLVNVILLSGILLAVKYLQLYIDYFSLYCFKYKAILSN